MANTRHLGGDNVNDPDHDFDGTFPGSSPVPPKSENQDTRQAASHGPRNTRHQWRNYWQPIPPNIEVDSTALDREAARIAIQSIHEMLEGNRKSPATEPILRDPNGKAVLGSRAMTEDQIALYLQENPGSSFS